MGCNSSKLPKQNKKKMKKDKMKIKVHNNISLDKSLDSISKKSKSSSSSNKSKKSNDFYISEVQEQDQAQNSYQQFEDQQYQPRNSYYTNKDHNNNDNVIFEHSGGIQDDGGDGD